MTTVDTRGDSQTFNWLLANFVRSTDGVRDAVAVSSDGLLIAVSDGLDRTEADRLAAIVSGLSSLARSASKRYSFDGVKLIMIEMGRGFLLVSAIRDGSCLGVLADSSGELGLVGYEMAVLAERAGDLLACGAHRRPTGDAAAMSEPSQVPDDEGQFVRPFIITGGRSLPAQSDLRLETLVVALDAAEGAAPLAFEHQRIVTLCQEPTTVAHIAEAVGVPLGVAKVLVADLVVGGRLSCSQPAELPLHTLERIRDHVRAL